MTGIKNRHFPVIENLHYSAQILHQTINRQNYEDASQNYGFYSKGIDGESRKITVKYILLNKGLQIFADARIYVYICNSISRFM